MHQHAAIPGRSPARSADEPPARWPVRQRVAVHPAGQRVAQLAALANARAVPRPVFQRQINVAPPALPAAPNVAGNQLPADGIRSLLPVADATVGRVRRLSTEPDDPDGMRNWKAGPLLKDPSKHGKQNLTRMHAIRGKFGGPTDPDNMFLGTALSNNFSPSSHYSLVELPLENYMKGAPRGETRAFDYQVAPNFHNPPLYMLARIAGIADPNVRANFAAFVNAHVPNHFTCTATLYRQSGNRYAASGARQQIVATDVGAPAGPAPVPAVGPILPGVLGAAPAAALGAAATSVHASVAKARASTSEGSHAALAYGGAGALLGYAAASLLTGPVGWFAGGLGVLGAIYGYKRGDSD